jgi:hypothetical protein
VKLNLPEYSKTKYWCKSYPKGLPSDVTVPRVGLPQLIKRPLGKITAGWPCFMAERKLLATPWVIRSAILLQAIIDPETCEFLPPGEAGGRPLVLTPGPVWLLMNQFHPWIGGLEIGNACPVQTADKGGFEVFPSKANVGGPFENHASRVFQNHH